MLQAYCLVLLITIGQCYGSIKMILGTRQKFGQIHRELLLLIGLLLLSRTLLQIRFTKNGQSATLDFIFKATGVISNISMVPSKGDPELSDQLLAIISKIT